MIDDTKRLDWLLGHVNLTGLTPMCDMSILNNKEYCFIAWFQDSNHCVVRGDNFRECIDKAILGKAEKWR